MLALAHGTNDAQKTMGVITLALIAHGTLDADNFEVPFWVVVSAATAIAFRFKAAMQKLQKHNCAAAERSHRTKQNHAGSAGAYPIAQQNLEIHWQHPNLRTS